MTKWQQYEQEKAELEAALSAGRITYEEYERSIRELCKRLGV